MQLHILDGIIFLIFLAAALILNYSGNLKKIDYFDFYKRFWEYFFWFLLLAFFLRFVFPSDYNVIDVYNNLSFSW